MIRNLESKIDIQIQQLNPTLNHRNRRDLINGLGGIIRAITGNLDQDDAEKYDNAILKLSDSQQKIKTIVKDQVTLMQRSINDFNAKIKSISHNEKLLQNRFARIESVIKQVDHEYNELSERFFLQVTMIQIVSAYQNIFKIKHPAQFNSKTR